MTISAGKQPKDTTYNLNNKEKVKEEKDIGVTISSQLYL